MKKKVFMMSIAMMCSGTFVLGQQVKSIEKQFKLHWSSDIGNASYRTNMLFTGGQIIIGSNGSQYMDYYLDESNGVHVLNAKTGKKVRSFANENWGDMDVNGIVKYNSASSSNAKSTSIVWPVLLVLALLFCSRLG